MKIEYEYEEGLEAALIKPHSSDDETKMYLAEYTNLYEVQELDSSIDIPEDY